MVIILSECSSGVWCAVGSVLGAKLRGYSYQSARALPIKLIAAGLVDFDKAIALIGIDFLSIPSLPAPSKVFTRFLSPDPAAGFRRAANVRRIRDDGYGSRERGQNRWLAYRDRAALAGRPERPETTLSARPASPHI